MSANASARLSNRTTGNERPPTLSTAPPYGVGTERSSAVHSRTALACSARASPKPMRREFLIRVSSSARTTKPKSAT